MIDTLSYLVRHRIRERPFSRRWLKLWAKRVANVPGLIGILWRTARLSWRGTRVGSLSVVAKLEVNGKATRLQIGRECVLGNRVHLGLHDEIRIGDYVVINDGCMLLTASHDVDSPDWQHVRAPIVIEDRAWIATRAIILPGVTIGYAAVVGAGAVVTKDVPAYHVVAGSPARTVRQRAAAEFRYSAPRFLAPFEAWVGPPR
ncbi:MAG TPA: acyltransferase [Gammaproteobacteria bacterium]|nr:acyltransferase [Gammaproteobacteria bacterium]